MPRRTMRGARRPGRVWGSCGAPVLAALVDSREPVADAPHVLDEARVAGQGELVAQAAGVAVERAGLGGRPEAPDVAQELVLGVHAPRVGGQVGEQRVLRG